MHVAQKLRLNCSYGIGYYRERSTGMYTVLMQAAVFQPQFLDCFETNEIPLVSTIEGIQKRPSCKDGRVPKRRVSLVKSQELLSRLFPLHANSGFFAEMGLFLYAVVLMALFVLLWRVSSVAKYWIKFLVFCLVSLISACAPIPIMMLRPRDCRNALMPAAGLRACCRFLGITHSVEGLDNVVKDSGCVILINHQSMLDLIVLACLWPVMDNCAVISKREIFYLQPFGLASWLWGTIFIDRINAKGAQHAINKTGDTIRTRKARVLMFPEGTRNGSRKLLPFKKGAFHLAIASQCPIQPVAVSRYTFLGDQRFDDGHISIKILPPISTKGRTVQDLPELMEQAYKIMSDNVDLISKSNEDINSNNDKLKIN